MYYTGKKFKHKNKILYIVKLKYFKTILLKVGKNIEQLM